MSKAKDKLDAILHFHAQGRMGARSLAQHEKFENFTKQQIIDLFIEIAPEIKVHPENGLPTCEKQSCSISGYNQAIEDFKKSLNNLRGEV